MALKSLVCKENCAGCPAFTPNTHVGECDDGYTPVNPLCPRNISTTEVGFGYSSETGTTVMKVRTP